MCSRPRTVRRTRPGTFEHPDVLRRRVERDRVRRGEVGDPGVGVGEAGQDVPTGRVGDRREHPVEHRSLIFTHMGEYNGRDTGVQPAFPASCALRRRARTLHGLTMQIILSDFISLDGVSQAPGGPDEDTDGGFAHGGWSGPYFDPETMGANIGEVMERTDALLFGRRTWDGMAAAWPDRAGDPFADQMNAFPKYVASRTLSAGRRVVAVEQHDAARRRRRRARRDPRPARGGRDGGLQVWGSTSLASPTRGARPRRRVPAHARADPARRRQVDLPVRRPARAAGARLGAPRRPPACSSAPTGPSDRHSPPRPFGTVIRTRHCPLSHPDGGCRDSGRAEPCESGTHRLGGRPARRDADPNRARRSARYGHRTSPMHVAVSGLMGDRRLDERSSSRLFGRLRHRRVRDPRPSLAVARSTCASIAGGHARTASELVHR